MRTSPARARRLAPRASACAVLLAVFSLALAVPTRAEEPAASPGGAPELVVTGPVGLEDFLRSVATVLDVPLVWDPKSRALQGKEVAGTLRFTGTKDEMFSAVRSLLAFYELVVIPVGHGPNQKWLVMDARATAAIVKLKPLHVTITAENASELEGQDGLFVTARIPVENLANLRDARNALNRIVTGQNIGSVTEVPDARAFIVTDFAPNAVAIWRLVEEMDAASAGSPVTFRALRLGVVDAEAAADLLTRHFGANEPIKPAAPRPDGVSMEPTPTLRIHADPRLNQVLVSGTPADVERVAAVAAVLDQGAEGRLVPPPGPEGREEVRPVVSVVRLEHANARDVERTLARLVDEAPWGPGARPAVIAHGDTNVLLLMGTSDALGRLRDLAAELDRLEAAEQAGQEAPHSAGENPGARRVRLDLADVPLVDALEALARQAGLSVILSASAQEAVAGVHVTLQVADVPAREALRLLLEPYEDRLDVMVEAHGLVVVRAKGESR